VYTNTPEEKNVFKLLEDRVASPGEEPMFTWFKDGEKFEPSERFQVMFKVRHAAFTCC
jgi:hypothetical protein